jgi:Zn-dependent protease/CBS domain-containing protein
MQRASGIRLGRVLGIPIYLHASWFIIFALIVFTLQSQFKELHPNWTPAQHWILGIATALLFFGSVVFHELSHSMVAKHYHIPVRSITLFVFGGLAQIDSEPTSAMQEFNIAIAGPLSSFVLAAAFYVISIAPLSNQLVVATSQWLAGTNAVLAVFNLVPGFPLDGGRVLRALVWGATKDFQRATQIAARSGQAIAYLMIFYGIWQFMSGNRTGGLWLAFIGWFLLTAAQESYTQVAIRSTLAGVKAGDIMTRDIPTVGREVSVQDYVHEVLRTGIRCHVVVAGEQPVGLITLHAARQAPREEWTNTSVQAVMVPLDKIQWARPVEPVLGVLERMQQQDVNQMPVIDEGHILGMIARDTILKALQTRIRANSLAEQ